MRGLVITIIVLVGAIFVGFLAWSRLPDMLANNLSKKLGVSVSIQSMGARPKKLTLNQITIGNPPRYSLPKAFSARETELDAPLTTYFQGHVLVDEIAMEDIYLGLEFDSPSAAKGNWSTIFGNLEKEGKLDKKDGKKVTIKRLVCKNIRTELMFKSDGKVRKLPVIKQIVLKDISTEGGVSSDQLAGSILGQMIKQVFLEQNLNNMIKGLFTDPGGAVDTFLKPFQGIFNWMPEDDIIECM